MRTALIIGVFILGFAVMAAAQEMQPNQEVELWKLAFAKVPELTVLGTVVFIFLRFIGRMQSEASKVNENTLKALQASTEAMVRVEAAMAKREDTVDELCKVVEKAVLMLQFGIPRERGREEG